MVGRKSDYCQGGPVRTKNTFVFLLFLEIILIHRRTALAIRAHATVLSYCTYIKEASDLIFGTFQTHIVIFRPFFFGGFDLRDLLKHTPPLERPYG